MDKREVLPEIKKSIMDKLTNEEIAKVFGLYGIGAHVLTIDSKAKVLTIHAKAVTVSLDTIKHGQNLHGIDNGNGGLHRTYLNKDNKCNLLLFPLSKITDEHARQVGVMEGWCIINWPKDESVMKYAAFKLTRHDYNYITAQYLISKGYAVPLWFGIDHWANGKTAIEIGIAIEKI